MDLRNFPYLRRKSNFNSSESQSFDSPNSFNILDSDEYGGSYISYADITKTSSPLDPGSHSSGTNKSRPSPLSATPLGKTPPRRNTGHQHPNNTGYDRRAHQNALFGYQGGNGYFSANGLAYPSVPPPQHDFHNTNPPLNTNFITELMNLISELVYCFQNRDFTSIMNIILSFIRNLGFPSNMHDSPNNPRFPPSLQFPL